MAKRIPIPNTQTGSLTDHQFGTDDTLTALTGGVLYGDALNMLDNSHGGNDTLIGGFGAGFNTLVGDAKLMLNNSVGGNDTLIGGEDRVHNRPRGRRRRDA